MPKRLFDAVGALNKAVAQRDQKVNRIEQDYPDEKLRTDAYNTCKQRLAAVNLEFEKGEFVASKPSETYDVHAFGIARTSDLNGNEADDLIIYHPGIDNSERVEVILF